MIFRKDDHVVFRCTRPATGFIKRVAKDQSWADVQWHNGVNLFRVRRHNTRFLCKTSPIFNRIANDPSMKVWLPEAFE